jgi:hypothetical protein
MGVNPCGRCVVGAPLPQIAKLPQNIQQMMVSRFVSEFE